MKRPAEFFSVLAIAILVLGQVLRFIAPNFYVAMQWHGRGYAFPPFAASVVITTFLCFVASIYSLWMLPMNQKAEMWHFWLTAAAIGVFWASFSGILAAGASHASATAALVIWGQLAAVAVFLIAQLIFVANLVLALT